MRIQKNIFVVLFCLLIGLGSQVHAISLLPMVPQDAYFTVSFNVSRIFQQPDLKSLVEQKVSLDKNNYSDFYKKAGIDPTRDIGKVMLFLTSNEKAGVIVNGTFDTQKFLNAVNSDSNASKQLKVSDFHGYNLLKSSANQHGNVVLLDKNTLAFGHMDVISGLVKVHKREAKSIMANKDFANLMEKMNTRATMWGAALTSGNWSKVKNPILANTMKDIKTAFFSLNYGNSFNFNFTGYVQEEAQLPALKDGLQNFLDGFKGWTAGVPEMHELLKSAKVQAKGKLARIVLKVEGKKFNRLMTGVGKRAENEAKK